MRRESVKIWLFWPKREVVQDESENLNPQESRTTIKDSEAKLKRLPLAQNGTI